MNLGLAYKFRNGSMDGAEVFYPEISSDPQVSSLNVRVLLVLVTLC